MAKGKVLRKEPLQKQKAFLDLYMETNDAMNSYIAIYGKKDHPDLMRSNYTNILRLERCKKYLEERNAVINKKVQENVSITKEKMVNNLIIASEDAIKLKNFTAYGKLQHQIAMLLGYYTPQQIETKVSFTAQFG